MKKLLTVTIYKPKYCSFVGTLRFTHEKITVTKNFVDLKSNWALKSNKKGLFPQIMLKNLCLPPQEEEYQQDL